ncbi:hypothetical protein [Streptomyces pseudogriseolus]|uniref:hypothetical protein n=1 Tax=Streptomyces pseudogriseolus TaxID=36817 RepID=UPI003FA2F60F
MAAGMNPDQIDDPRVDDHGRALMVRLARLGPLYGSEVPKAALYLDDLIDTGYLSIFCEGEEGTLVPLAEAAARFGTTADVRQSLHNLHAVGALLVDTDDEHDVAFIRLVAKRPEEPGQPWRFQGDPDCGHCDGLHAEPHLGGFASRGCRGRGVPADVPVRSGGARP